MHGRRTWEPAGLVVPRDDLSEDARSTSNGSWMDTRAWSLGSSSVRAARLLLLLPACHPVVACRARWEGTYGSQNGDSGTRNRAR